MYNAVLPHTQQMRGMYTNANCLSNKHSELRGRIDKERPDVIGITEIWQKEEFEIKGYQQVRKDRNKNGGSICTVKPLFWSLIRS